MMMSEYVVCQACEGLPPYDEVMFMWNISTKIAYLAELPTVLHETLPTDITFLSIKQNLTQRSTCLQISIISQQISHPIFIYSFYEARAVELKRWADLSTYNW